ncbi:recombinase family protein [Gudongella sp. SC589]|uniref:recombinase family protein n=1 Tax=Gudongella sp. SC589 TaxID=3385990 RepID=UPI003904A628
MKKITKIDEISKSQSSNIKLRVAAYARVSTDSDEQMVSLKAQREHYEKYIKSNPEWEFAGLYYDEGISGTKKEKRPELLRMIRDCENDRIDFIITKSISRFARNTTDCLELVRQLLNIGVFIYFEKENLNTGDMESELMLSILSGFAAEESASISQNTTWSINKRFQNGNYIIGSPPYGYANVNGEMVIVPEEAEIVKRIFSECLAGKGGSVIAKGLNRDKIPARRGNHWSTGTVIDMLRNEKYKGDALFQKTYTDNNYNRRPNKGEKDQFYCKNHHEPIVSREVFSKAQKLITQRAKSKTVNKNVYQNRYVLSGKIICGECGSTFRRKTNYSAGRSYIAWSCIGHIEDKNSCSMLFLRDGELKATYATMLNKLAFSRKIILEPLYKAISQIDEKSDLERINAIDNRLEQLTEERNTLVGLMTKGFLEPALFRKERNVLDREINSLTTEKTNLVMAFTDGTSQADEVKSLLDYVAEQDFIGEYTEEAFEKYVQNIIVNTRDELTFKMKCGLSLKEEVVR